MPRFYRFDPLKDTHPELEAEILQMVQENEVKATTVLNWHLGDIATVGNAALTGFGSTRRILIADTLLEQYTTEEIKWILMHEIAHFKHRDLWRQLLVGVFTTTLMFFLTDLSFSSMASFLGYSLSISSVGALPVLGVCFWVINTVLINVPSLWYSRKRETAADTRASSYIGDPAVTKSLFIKMADQNLADIDPPLWEKYLFMSHPPIKERIVRAAYRG
jgi:STE24 endopeptidase